MARPVRKKIRWPAWRYGPDGQAQIFQSASEVPEGWKDHSVPVPERQSRGDVVVDRAALAEQLKARGIKVNPMWGASKMQEILENE
jgi:hypothetical protein